jgi:hypothetical protein
MKITAEFTTDRELTPAEVSALLDAIYLQIKEPWDADNQDADFKTGQVKVVLTEGQVTE